MLVGCSGLFWECRDTPHPMVEIPQGWGPTQTHVCPPFPPPQEGTWQWVPGMAAVPKHHPVWGQA